LQCYRSTPPAVIYFSGYGLAIDDGNSLIAADAKISSVPDSADEFVPLNWILLAVVARKLNLVIVDACRENPFHRVSEASSEAQGAALGLGDVKLKVHNMLIALAANVRECPMLVSGVADDQRNPPVGARAAPGRQADYKRQRQRGHEFEQRTHATARAAPLVRTVRVPRSPGVRLQPRQPILPCRPAARQIKFPAAP
jgi:hypothetical protein